MGLKCAHLLAIIFAFGVLGAIILSFFTVTLSKIEPVRDRLTGYPTWHGVFQGFDRQKKDTMGTFIAVIMLVVGVIGLKLVLNPPTKPSLITKFYTVSDDPDDDNQESAISEVSTIDFNRSLVTYTLVTSITALASLIVDVGKLWSAIGVFHNTIEIIILLLIGSGGRIKNVSYFVWVLIYIVSVAGICIIFSDFPIDALFFKIQGLCMDYALVIEFVRIYISTKNHQYAGKDKLPLDNDDNNDNKSKLLPITFNHHNSIIFLILASSAHVFGNLLSTIYLSSALANLIFQICYAIVYPLYILFVYVDIQTTSIGSPKRICLPYTPTWKVIVISIFSLTLSLLSIRLSFRQPLKDWYNHDFKSITS